MNTGQKLVELSGLSGVSAIAHLLAITQGSGTGPAKTIFASQMVVCAETPQITLVQRERSQSVQHVAAEAHAVQQSRPNRICAMTKPARIDVTTTQKAWFVRQRKTSELRVSVAPKSVVTRRSRKTVSI